MCQVIDTLELVSVGLLHPQAVLLSLEDLCLIQLIEPTPGEATLP